MMTARHGSAGLTVASDGASQFFFFEIDECFSNVSLDPPDVAVGRVCFEEKHASPDSFCLIKHCEAASFKVR